MWGSPALGILRTFSRAVRPAVVDFRPAAVTGGAKSANGRGMKPFIATLFLILFGLPACATAALPLRGIIVCPVRGDQPPARFDAPDCRPVALSALDPQGRDIWVHGHIEVPAASDGPLGLYVLAKASSEVWLNGVRLGANGVPAATKAEETPGRMDIAFPIPASALRIGSNEIVLRMSSFHDVIHLSQPVHMLAIAPYADPVDVILRAYWPSLVTFGVLLAGAFFFASSAISAVNRRDPLLLALLSLISAGQLFAEVLRGLIPYPYPVQDWRLIAITACSTFFAVTLAALITLRFQTPRPRLVFAGVLAMILFPLLIFPGFDGKAAFAIMASALACAGIAGWAALKGDRSALISCLVLLVFAASVLVFQSRFLDTIVFYEVAALLLVLFTIRALTFERQRQDHETMHIRAHDLELALIRATEAKTPSTLRINSAGAVTLVNTADITLCKGADDYVELHLSGGRTVLHNGALGDLEAALPSHFLRVHRSFVVNTAFVEKLTRDVGGTGFLTLSNGAQAPVSRRIMPKVREALG
jgi:hypothetical protein